jgi:uncharacterized membrane protein
MTMLLVGIVLFALLHLSPAVTPGIKAGITARFGTGAYRGLMTLFIIVAMVLIVLGWRAAQPELLYLPSAPLRHPAMAMVAVAFFLMVTSTRPSRLRQWVRHPQLTGVIVWAAAHLLLNGDDRSVVLFGGLGLWAAIEIIVINRRDSGWERPAIPPLSAELVNLLITLAVVALVAVLHPYFSGMPVM